MKSTQIWLLVLLAFSGGGLFGQVEVKFTTGEPSPDLQGLWDITLLNTGSETRTVLIEGRIIDLPNQEIFRARSREVTLMPGSQAVTMPQLQPLNVEIQALMGGGKLPPGGYRYWVRVIDVRENRLVGETSENITVKDAQETESGGKASDPFFKFGGQARITAQYSDRQGTGQEIPSQWVRIDAQPTVAFGGLPLAANFLYSTEQSPDRQNINQFNIHFDAQTFQQNLRQKTMSKIADLQAINEPETMGQLEEMRDKMLKKKFGDLGKLREKLSDPGLQGELSQLQALGPLEQALEHPRFQQGLQKLDSLEQQYNIQSEEDLTRICDTIPAEDCQKMRRLYQLKNDYEKLKKRKEELEVKQKKLRKYQRMGEKLEKANRVNVGSLLADPRNMRKGMRTLGVQTASDQLLGSIRNVSIGTDYPNYSPLTINGVGVNGGGFEWNPSIFYIAATKGTVQKEIRDTSFNSFQALERDLWAVKAGLGKKESTHIFFTYLDAEDKGESIWLRDSTTLDPQRFKVLGTDVRLSLFQRNLTVQGFGGISLHDWNKNAPKLDSATQAGIIPSEVTGFIPDLVEDDINATSHLDYAYRVQGELKLFNQNTRMSGHYGYTGSGYVSPGAPMLIRDRIRYEGRLEQRLLKNQVSMSLFYRNDHDNIDNWKGSTTNTTYMGGMVFIRFRKLPFIQLQYAPLSQENNGSSGFTNDNRMIQGMIGHSIKLKKSVLSASFNLVDQVANSSQPYSNYTSRIGNLTTSLSTSKGLFANLSGSVIDQENLAIGKQRILNADLSGGARIFKVWNHLVGVQYYSQTGGDERWGFYWNTTFPVTKYARFDFRVQRSVFNPVVMPSDAYQEWVVRGGLTLRLN